MSNKIKLIISYILVAALASGISFGLSTAFSPVSKLIEIEKLVDERFIENADLITMEDAAASAMIASLGDRWSYYIPAAEYEAYAEQVENAYVGIGITISKEERGSGFLIESVVMDGPAAEAGIQQGDIIVTIEGQSTAEMTTADARNLVRGKEGTNVSLTVLRLGEGISFSIPRRQVNTVVSSGEMISDTIGMVAISNFDSRCAEETIHQIDSLMDSGAKMLVFDVRNNPGGYAAELVKILDYLLPEGELFRTVDYAGNEHVDRSDASCLNIPMVVLVNGDSYSAAEFFAAAIREYDAGIVIGEQTCGKGYFQNTFRLSDGSAIGISVGKYYTPKGNHLAGVGITPDIVVAVDEETADGIYYGTIPAEEDPQIIAAIDYLKEVEAKKNS